jgi:NAD(P)-dependent dehydrogenase (short-subunit alcohol dehydrogenase family)
VEEPEFKSCIVTGANAGLGYWTSMELAKLGWTIFMLCRSEEKGKVAKNEIALETSNSNIHVVVVELSSLKSISKAVEAIRSKTSKIDVLINNAATVSSKRLLTERGVELQFAIKSFGTILSDTSRDTFINKIKRSKGRKYQL